jgi:hypothetical protein
VPVAALTTLGGSGLSGAPVGHRARLLIHPRDQFGNVLDAATDAPLTVTLRGAQQGMQETRVGPRLTCAAAGPEEATAVVSHNLDGSFAADYEVATAGAYEVSVLLAGMHIQGSPFRLNAAAGASVVRVRGSCGALTRHQASRTRGIASRASRARCGWLPACRPRSPSPCAVWF